MRAEYWFRYVFELDRYSCFATWAEHEGWKSVLYPWVIGRGTPPAAVSEGHCKKASILSSSHLHEYLGPTTLISASAWI